MAGLESMGEPHNATGPLNEIDRIGTVIFARRRTAPLPVCEKFPEELMCAPASIRKSPLLLTVRGPLPAVVTGAPNVNWLPVKTTPPANEVAIAPLNVLKPVPAD